MLEPQGRSNSLPYEFVGYEHVVKTNQISFDSIRSSIVCFINDLYLSFVSSNDAHKNVMTLVNKERELIDDMQKPGHSQEMPVDHNHMVEQRKMIFRSVNKSNAEAIERAVEVNGWLAQPGKDDRSSEITRIYCQSGQQFKITNELEFDANRAKTDLDKLHEAIMDYRIGMRTLIETEWAWSTSFNNEYTRLNTAFKKAVSDMIVDAEEEHSLIATDRKIIAVLQNNGITLKDNIVS